jgi:phosphoglycolate phosphatase
MNIAAVVFDLDGTLLDSLADIANAANHVLQRNGLPTYDLQAYRYFVGSGVRHLLNCTLPEQVRENESLKSQLIEEFVDQYRSAWNIQSHLYDGIVPMLDELQHRGLAMAVLSNKPQAATSQCVDYYLSQYAFVSVLGQCETRPPKPDLTGAREILAQLAVEPAACLYLGDTAVDMQTACGAGMIPIGATWGFRTRDELEQSGARMIIDHPSQLARTIDTYNSK